MLTISPRRTQPILVVMTGLLFAVLVIAPTALSPFGLRVGHSIFLGAGLALSWFILAGFASYFSLGHTVFVGTGAFGAAIFQRYCEPGQWTTDMIATLIAGVLASVVLASAVAWPLLRLRGHYFTIGMLALALVAAEIVNSVSFFGGSVGIDLRSLGPEWMRPELFFYYLLLAALAITLLVAHWLKHSRVGYGLMSIRENEDAAEMLGVPTARFKSIGFVISAGLCGLFGAILASNLGYVTTNSVFSEQISLEMILYCLLGGMGSIAGPVIGAVVFTILTKVLLIDFLSIHLALTGLIMILVVLVAPNGVFGGLLWLWRRRPRGPRSKPRAERAGAWSR
jgi:branched-chain amino acid transport system permease protein